MSENRIKNYGFRLVIYWFLSIISLIMALFFILANSSVMLEKNLLNESFSKDAYDALRLPVLIFGTSILFSAYLINPKVKKRIGWFFLSVHVLLIFLSSLIVIFTYLTFSVYEKSKGSLDEVGLFMYNKIGMWSALSVLIIPILISIYAFLIRKRSSPNS